MRWILQGLRASEKSCTLCDSLTCSLSNSCNMCNSSGLKSTVTLKSAVHSNYNGCFIEQFHWNQHAQKITSNTVFFANSCISWYKFIQHNWKSCLWHRTYLIECLSLYRYICFGKCQPLTTQSLATICQATLLSLGKCHQTQNTENMYISVINFQWYCSQRNGFQWFDHSSFDYDYMNQLWNDM